MSISPRLLGLLACPQCGGEIRQTQPCELVCQSCQQSYPIIDDVPRMLPREIPVSATRTVEGFAEQWKTYSNWSPHYKQQFLRWLNPVPADFLAGKVILDAGCGKGRHLIASSEQI